MITLGSNPVEHVLVGLVVGLLTAQLTILVTTVYLHRALTHGALTMHPAAALPCRVIVWLTSGIRPRDWVGVHRRHHAALDTPDDPHSPALLGTWRVLATNALLYRRATRNRALVERYTRDLRRDWLDRAVFDRQTLGPLLGIAILVIAFGWVAGLVAAVVHGLAYVGLSGAINALGHTWGRRPQRNSGTNGWVLALLTAGEGLHNNHHAGATAARLSWRRFEVDPGWWLVRALCVLRLARLRHPGGLLPAAGPTGNAQCLAA